MLLNSKVMSGDRVQIRCAPTPGDLDIVVAAGTDADPYWIRAGARAKQALIGPGLVGMKIGEMKTIVLDAERDAGRSFSFDVEILAIKVADRS